MSNRKGTPKTLDAAIKNSIYEINQKLLDNRVACFHDHIKDFMAQKFGVAYMEALDDKAILRVLEKLFEELTKRD